MNKVLSVVLLSATLMIARILQSVSGDLQRADQNTWRGNRVRAAGNGPRRL